MIRFTLLLLPMLLLLSCSQPFSHDISGVIYEKTRDDLFQHDFSKIIIDINSPGGVAGPSIEIAELLMKKNVVLNVKDICNSACSQLILPIADKINFIDEPLIGFHWDMILDVEYFKRNGEDYKTCLGLNEAYERERIILEHNGLNQDFWKEIDKRLMMQNFNVTKDINGDCIDYIYDLKHIMWYPTSSQLKDLFGLKFKGSVCADDYTACSEKITEIAAKEGVKDNFSMVIGDKVYSHKIDK